MVLMERWIVDANSIIYLSKCGLLLPLTEIASLFTAPEVVQECLSEYKRHLPDAVYIQRMIEDKLLQIQLQPWLPDDALLRMGKGERAVIALYKNQKADAILTDDGKAIKYCKLNAITHYSSPMIPVKLYWKGVIDIDCAYRAIEELSRLGYYSKAVLHHVYNRLFAFNLR
ncbi:MAG: hypothetical protein Q8Q33_02130 [Chlamydiota bacterium]|nr:hypothetical protein [Chlamydiota bacterium]